MCQVVDVPVRSIALFKMVPGARLQTARAEGTADIDIKTGLKEEGAEFADLDRFFI